MRASEPVDPWIEQLEGLGQGSADAAHWLRVYAELIRTLEGILFDGGANQTEARRRLNAARRRYAEWERVSRAARARAGLALPIEALPNVEPELNT